MHLNWKSPISRVLVSSVVAMLATTSVYAIPKGPCDTKPEVCCEEPKPGPFAFAYPVDMNITCPRDFYVHVDGLAFQAKQDGMEFAIVNAKNGAPTTNGIGDGEVLGFSNDHSDWDYNPGVRVGIGFFSDHDAWNIDFAWTWLNITNYKNESLSGHGILLPQFLVPQATGNGALNASDTTLGAVWKASYNVLDARLGKPYYVSRHLILNPHFGIRAGWIDQHFSVDYGGAFGTTSPVYKAIAHSDNDMWCFGARTGLNSDWILGKGWSLFGNLAGSILFSKFEIDQRLAYGSGEGDGYNFDDDFYQNITNVELALGISWGQHFDKNKYRVGLRAAYEFHEWFDLNNIRKVFGPGPYYATDRVSRGNFTLNGFSLSLSLDL